MLFHFFFSTPPKLNQDFKSKTSSEATDAQDQITQARPGNICVKLTNTPGSSAQIQHP